MSLSVNDATRSTGRSELKSPGVGRTQPRKTARVTRLRLSGLSSPLEFVNCPEVAKQLVLILRGWTVVMSDAADGAEPLARIEKTVRGYSWRKAALPVPHDWRKFPPRSTYEAVGHLHHELVDWLVAERAGALCLHCAAFDSGEGLVVLLGRGKAGKSTLTAELAAAGFRIFGDDVLLVEDGRQHGVALGLLPRLRLPLPETMSARARDFSAARVGLSDKRHQYIAMRPAELAPFGKVAPIAGLVILDRVDGGPASLDPVSHGDMLKTVILQNCLDAIPAKPTFDRLLALTAKARRFKLRYSSGAQAIRLLAETFAASGRAAKAG